MSYTYQHKRLGGADIDEEIRDTEAEAAHKVAELAFLASLLNRIAADHVRSRQYRRRSNISGAGFRRNQRRGPTS
jgi:hypothetical protein